MDSSRNHINKYEGPGQYNTNINILLLCFNLLFSNLLINTREKQELPGVEPVNSGLLDFANHCCHTEPYMGSIDSRLNIY